MDKVFINARFLTQPVTGVQRFAIELSLHLKRSYPAAVFVAPHTIIHPALAEELGAIKTGKLKGHLWEQLELPVYLNQKKNPLLVNFANTAPLFYTNQIVTVHDLAFKINPAWFSKGFSIYYNFLIPRIARRAKKVLTVSESSKGDLHRAYNIHENKIEVIYNAVSTNLEITNKDYVSGYNSYILAVASLDPRKNFIKLIQAFQKVPAKNLKLLLVGAQNKNFSGALPPGILNDGNIICLGYVSDEELAAFYSQAAAFVYPSFYEGFGLPNIEAMHFGCPVITSDIAVCREVCGNAAIYVDPNDTAQIAGAIQQLLTDDQLKERLIQAGLKQACKFSWQDSARKLTAIIDDTLKTI